MKYDAVIFDLDGTLLDTLCDLRDSVNFALSAFGFPPRTTQEIRAFVGNGIGKLIKRSVPDGCDDDTFERVLAAFREHYALHNADHTCPYDGVIHLLETLKARGIPLAVVSNKIDSAVKVLCEKYFPGLLSVSIGELSGVKRKPAPDTVFLAMEKLCSVSPLYVGDSEVDVMTARKAGIDGVVVTGGFRSSRALQAAGAERIVHDVESLLEVIG